MSSEPVIEIAGVGKNFAIFSRPQDRLRQMIVPRLQRMVGATPSRYFREFWALRDVSFAVAPGETVGIIGRNGSGKSTLLQIVCGILRESTGTVRTRGRIAALLELGAGFNPEFTGRENAILNASILGIERKAFEARLDDVIAFAGIGDFIDQPVKTYSSGMYIRLAFAVAVHTDPEILVIDEALAVGDAAFQVKCLQKIRAMQKAGVSILLVTHSSNAVIEYCDRAIYLRQGRVAFAGACREAVDRYAADLVEEEGGIMVPAAGAEPIDGIAVPPPLRLGPADAAAASPEDRARPRTEIVAVEITDDTGRPLVNASFAEAVTVWMTVRFNEPNPAPCFGIQVSSVEGIVLWTAHTAGMGIDVPPAAAGSVRRFRWTLRLYADACRLVFALGVGEFTDGDYRRHHRIGYAGHVDVLARRRGTYGWLGVDPEFVPEAVIG